MHRIVSHKHAYVFAAVRLGSHRASIHVASSCDRSILRQHSEPGPPFADDGGAQCVIMTVAPLTTICTCASMSIRAKFVCRNAVGLRTVIMNFDARSPWFMKGGGRGVTVITAGVARKSIPDKPISKIARPRRQLQPLQPEIATRRSGI